MTATRKAKQTAPKFENRVRFNWGYHDAALAVERGWACPERNFGFAVGGPMDGLASVADILARHFDRVYAQGWQAGYEDARDGMYEARGQNGEEAWEVAVRLGLVSE